MKLKSRKFEHPDLSHSDPQTPVIPSPKPLSFRAQTFVIPSIVEESYAEPQDPSTTLRYVQDMTDCFTRNSKLITEFPYHSEPKPLSFRAQTLVIPTVVEESYAEPQDSSTALRYVQDACFFS